MAVTHVRVIVERRAVHGAAVVPEGDGVLLPAEAALELRRLAVAHQHLQKRVALVLLQALDALGEAAIDEQALAAGHRMRAHDGMDGLGELLVAALVFAARIDMGAGVERRQALDQPLDRLRQRLVGEIHVGEGRVAADRRRLVQVEDRAHRRLGLARHVGMPDLARRRLGLLVGMHDADLGMALDLGPGRRMDQKLAEQAAERLVLLDAHLLVAEEQHVMRHQRIVQLARLLVGQRRRDRRRTLPRRSPA